MISRFADRLTTRLAAITGGLQGSVVANVGRRHGIVRSFELTRGRITVVLIIPFRRLWVGSTADRARAAHVHEAFIEILRKFGMPVVDIRDRF